MGYLGGIVELEVVIRPESWHGEPQRCSNLGHGRYKCACGRGYFLVRTRDDHDERCPECKKWVAVRESER